MPFIVVQQMDLRQSIDFFVKNVLNSSSKEELEACTELMGVVASLIHEHTKR
jgi:hypothetical protein